MVSSNEPYLRGRLLAFFLFQDIAARLCVLSKLSLVYVYSVYSSGNYIDSQYSLLLLIWFFKWSDIKTSLKYNRMAWHPQIIQFCR